MSRRRLPEASSLELLLDTICNTFGGVLFIAILVVLLLQQAGNSPAAPTPSTTTMSPLEVLALTTRMDEVNDQLIRLRQNRDSQDAVVREFAPEPLRELLANRSAVTLQQEALQGEVDQLLAENVTLAAHVEELQVENESVRPKLEESRKRRDALLASLEEDRQSRVENVRLPVARAEWGKVEVGLVLRYGRVYVWHKYADGYMKTGLNTIDFVVVSEEDGGLVTHPNPVRGVIVDGSESSNRNVRQVLRQFDPKRCYLAVVARPDSYGEFRYLRDQAIEMGFEYRLMAVGANSPIVDRGGHRGQVQ